MVVRDIALGLSKAGWPAGVCALEYDGPLSAELNEQGITTVVIAKQGGEILGPMYRLWRAFRAFRPNVVHTHHFYELLFAWPGALLCGARLVHTEHEFHSLSAVRARRLLRLLSVLCHKVTAVNRETAEYLREVVKIPPDKVVTIVNGIDLQRFASSRSAGIRTAASISPATSIIGTVARLEPPKNHALLLKAFRLVLDQAHDAHLLVVGDGSLRTSLEALSTELLLAGRITFLGARRDIPELLADMDIFVLSSDLEGLPVALLEAMAAGVPVVATAAGGIPSVVTDGVTGLLAKPGDDVGLAANISMMIDNKPLAKQFAGKAQEFVREYYNAKSVQEQYGAIYS